MTGLSSAALLAPRCPQRHAEYVSFLIGCSDASFQCACNDTRFPLLTRQRLECADIFLRPRPHFRSLLRHLYSPRITIAGLSDSSLILIQKALPILSFSAL